MSGQECDEFLFLEFGEALDVVLSAKVFEQFYGDFSFECGDECWCAVFHFLLVFLGDVIDAVFEIFAEVFFGSENVQYGCGLVRVSVAEDSAFLYKGGDATGGKFGGGSGDDGDLVGDEAVVEGVGVVDASVGEAVGEDDDGAFDGVE